MVTISLRSESQESTKKSPFSVKQASKSTSSDYKKVANKAVNQVQNYRRSKRLHDANSSHNWNFKTGQQATGDNFINFQSSSLARQTHTLIPNDASPNENLLDNKILLRRPNEIHKERMKRSSCCLNSGKV